MDVSEIETLTKNAKNLKLLYVEDDEFARDSTIATLNMFFDSITVGVDGEDGLELFKNGEFDLIITDINMPRMNGIGMISQIRKLNKKVTILVLSAHDDTSYFESTIKAGIDGYLLKPLDLQQFMELLVKSIEKINMAKELDAYKYSLEEKVQEQTKKIKEHLHRDSLTGLYNFLKLEEDIETGRFKTLMVFDITQLLLIAKQYGRIFAGKLLSEIARTLTENLSSDMSLYKLEADKFAVLYAKDCREDIKSFCEQVLAYYDMTPLNVDEIDINITFSIGISDVNGDASSSIDAEYALGNAKKIGRRYYFFYDINDHVILEEKEMIKWLKITKNLIEEEKILPYYQPILDIKTQKIGKYEVLARADLDGKIIPPFRFLDAAEKLGILSSITRMIIQKSFQFFQRNSYEFSINIAQRDLAEGYLPAFFAQKLELYDIEASRVTLEILENITVSVDNKHIQNELDRLKEMGFSIAVDDFGVENSNFGRLIDINLDIIKIDGFFIKNIVKSEKDKLIVKSIASLAKTLNIKVVAEYVESKEILEIIEELGIDYAQGYYIGKPEPYLLESVNF